MLWPDGGTAEQEVDPSATATYSPSTPAPPRNSPNSAPGFYDLLISTTMRHSPRTAQARHQLEEEPQRTDRTRTRSAGTTNGSAGSNSRSPCASGTSRTPPTPPKYGSRSTPASKRRADKDDQDCLAYAITRSPPPNKDCPTSSRPTRCSSSVRTRASASGRKASAPRTLRLTGRPQPRSRISTTGRTGSTSWSGACRKTRSRRGRNLSPRGKRDAANRSEHGQRPEGSMDG